MKKNIVIERKHIRKMIRNMIERDSTAQWQFLDSEIKFLYEMNLINRKQARHLLNENPAAGVAATLGLSVLTSLLASSQGRNRLADIISSLPNLIIAVCSSGVVLARNAFNMETADSTAATIGKICKFVTYLNPLSGPVAIACTAVASLLRLLDDDSAKIVINEVNNSTKKDKNTESEALPSDLADDTADIDPYDAGMEPVDTVLDRSSEDAKMVAEIRKYIYSA